MKIRSSVHGRRFRWAVRELADWLVRSGIAADEKKTNSILIVAAIIFAAAPVFFFAKFLKDRPSLTERDYELTSPPSAEMERS